MKEQKLQLKLKNVPMNASQVHCSTSFVLNSLETNSEQNIVLDCNTSDVNLTGFTDPERNVSKTVNHKTVFVKSINNEPLMPCTPTKARHMLKKGEAHVVKLNPFTIKLNFECENKVQVGKLKIDDGYKHVGFSVTNEKEELLSGEIELDMDTSKRLTEKKMYRKNRRYRLWYRKPKFNNRKKDQGWLPPSIKRKHNTIHRFIDKVKSLLPINKIIIEVGKFDVQKVMNPDIEGIEYQNGNLKGYDDIRSYLFIREQGKCQICGEKIYNKANTHHVTQRKNNGSNSVNNLVLLHEDCHIKFHQGIIKAKFKKCKSFRAESYMSITQSYFKKYTNYKITYGWKTSKKRNEFAIEKTHYNDAFVMEDNGNQIRNSKIYYIKQKRINNRSLQINKKKIGICIRKQRYSIQNGDFVWINNKKYLCGGSANKGQTIYYYDKEIKKTIGYKKIQKTYHNNSLIWF